MQLPLIKPPPALPLEGPLPTFKCPEVESIKMKVFFFTCSQSEPTLFQGVNNVLVSLRNSAQRTQCLGMSDG